MIETDKAFTGSLPKIYGTYLVPLFFEPYAHDLVNRLRNRQLSNLLETAAGTGVVTRLLDSTLPANVSITATDLNQAMIDQAKQSTMQRKVEWLQADAMQLPFDNETFDAVLCQFGVMFFPDKPKAFSEAYRVLKPDGIFLFNVWDSIRENEFSDAVTTAMESIFPDDPPRFLPRTPYGYHDEKQIAEDLSKGGFRSLPVFDTVITRGKAASPGIPAMAICQGTPLRNEIESRNASMLDKATQVATEAIAKRFGQGAVDGKMQAKVVAVEK
jgi:ubiquinone/menaquinone biosynthesis C-methylase UbiE